MMRGMADETYTDTPLKIGTDLVFVLKFPAGLELALVQQAINFCGQVAQGVVDPLMADVVLTGVFGTDAWAENVWAATQQPMQ